MAFDPDAFLTSTARFDPDAFLARDQAQPAQRVDAPAAPAPGIGESVARGALQGATFGFADEISGAIEGALSDKPFTTAYREARDASRARFRAAEAANPKASFVGNIVGGFAVPGLGAAKAAKTTATTIGGALKTGAKLGAVSGLGASEATDAAGLAGDVVRGGVGGAVGGAALKGAGDWIGRRLARAPERVAQRTVKDVVHGESTAKLSTAKRVAARAGEDGEDLQDILRAVPSLRRTLAVDAAGNPRRAAEAVEAKLSTVNSELGQLYQKLDESGGVRLLDLGITLDKMRRQLLNAGNPKAAQVMDDARTQYVNAFGVDGKIPESTRLPASLLRGLKAELGRSAFRGDPDTAPTISVGTQRKLYGELDRIIENLAEKAKGVDAGDLKRLNREASTLIPVSQALAERATKETAGRSSFSTIMERAQTVGGPLGGAMLGGSVGGIPGAIAGVALPAAGRLSARTGRAIDYELARLLEQEAAGVPSRLLGAGRAVGRAGVVGGTAAGGIQGGSAAAREPVRAYDPELEAERARMRDDGGTIRL